METKVPCQRCKRLILPMTASRNSGLCMRCVGCPQLPATCTDRPRGIGYWCRSDDLERFPFPDPSTLVGRSSLSPDSRMQLLQYLRSAPILRGFWGYSFCRFGCGVTYRVMGFREYWDGAWVWPEGLAHYVECHDVGLPEEFIERALSQPLPNLMDVPAYPEVEVEWDYWLQWSGQMRYG